MPIKKILIGPSSFAEKDKTPLEMLKKENFQIINNPYGRKLTKEELKRLLDPEVTGLLAGLEPLDKDVLNNSKLKVISRVGAGMSNIDLDTARKLNIIIKNTPDAPTESVAELTIGALLNLARLIAQMNDEMHAGKWTKMIGLQLKGKTCLIVGFGRIGKRVANILKAFGVTIVYYDPYIEDESEFIKVNALEDILNSTDIICLHNSGEECILNEREFSLMKTGVILLNASRGSAIDENALIKALNNKKVSGVWLDTFSNEPYKGELINYSNVLLTPHVGSYTLECRRNMEIEAVDNLIKALE